MSELSTEVIVFEILTRLPAKFVGRSKSVCKEWNVLLSGHEFIKKHCSRSFSTSSQKFIIIEPQACSIYPIDFETLNHEPAISLTIPFDRRSYTTPYFDISILAHLQGLLCVCLERTTELFLWNPLTTALKRLPFPFPNDFFQGIFDAVGLYTDAQDDFKVLYIRRRDSVIYANVYSRNEDSWRNISLSLPPEYLTARFYWSSGTLCARTLYFIVNDIMIGGTRFMVSFVINSEQFYVHRLPPIPNHGLAHVRLMGVQDKLVMFAATGRNSIQIDVWIYEEDIWYWVFSFPKISPNLWYSVTHFVTTGNKWFVMANSHKIFEVNTDRPRHDRLYSSTYWTYFRGALFTETLVSPSN